MRLEEDEKRNNELKKLLKLQYNSNLKIYTGGSGEHNQCCTKPSK